MVSSSRVSSASFSDEPSEWPFLFSEWALISIYSFGLYSITCPVLRLLTCFLFFSLHTTVLVSGLDGDDGLSFALTGLNLDLISWMKFWFLVFTYFSYGVMRWAPDLSNISFERPEILDILLLVLAKDSLTDFKSSLLWVFLTKYCFSVSFDNFLSFLDKSSTLIEMCYSSSSFFDFFAD